MTARGLHFEITPVGAEQTVPLRQRLLRPGSSLAACRFETDATPAALHLACFVGDEVVGIASVHAEPPPWDRGDAGPDAHDGARDMGTWRLRGMATMPELRRRGVGRWLAAACMQHALDAGGTLVWCNARVTATGFYRALGFEARGEVFDIPAAGGPHVTMWRQLAGAP